MVQRFTVQRRGWGLATVCAVLGALLWAQAARAEIIDRILAVVGRELITLSDVGAALRLGLVPMAAGGTDSRRATLDVLIARQLELGEVNRYLPPEPSASEIDGRFSAVRNRLPTPSGFDRALAQSGLNADQLRARLRDDLRIEAYLDQRFGAGLQPSEQELTAYYRDHQAELTAGGALRPFADVRDDVRARWLASQRRAVIAEWVDSLRRRTEVTDLYVASREGSVQK